MNTSDFAELSRFIRTASAISFVTIAAACGGSATEPEIPTTSFVSIVVSCDVAVQHDAGQWRVSYCTLSLGGGFSGSSLIVPDHNGTDRRASLLDFGACVNRKTSAEQQKCFKMLED